MAVSNLEKLRLLVDQDGGDTFSATREYDMYPIENVEPESRKEAVSISIPGRAASENILMGISGMQGEISISFMLWDDGTDRANGTHTSTVTSVEEQWNYLRDEIHAPGFSARWRLDHLTGDFFSGGEDDEVFVETIQPAIISQQNPKWKPCRMRIRRGGSDF